MGRLVSILALVLAGLACLPVGAQAAFGLDEFDVTFTSEDGSPAVQAGSHPFAFTTSLKTNVSGGEPQGRLRELFLDEIPGLMAAPNASPRCTAEDFDTLDEGMNDCPDATAVGIFESASGEPDNWTTAPVFNLVPPSGVLLRLGFRVAGAANAIVDFELSPEPPYRLLASIGEIPEVVELFAAELQLWGVPASPLHDALRGRCGVEGGSCPANVAQQPFLTLPTSCLGPQETFYEALSWEGDEGSGSAFTHDGADDPLGFGGCGSLAFDPKVALAPTTEAAASTTGLDISLDVEDEGLGNPAGLARSQIREALFALPEGMGAGSALTSGDSCTEAELEAETPEAPPAGCPSASQVGTAEVESPLLAEPIAGAVYRATPGENFAGDAPIGLYVVLRSPGLGILIAQPVGVEEELETGRLVAVAEDLPQLPFSHLEIQLDEGSGEGPLISPSLCGDYEAEAQLVPWAGNGTIAASSLFSIVSGPGEGPCPEEGEGDESDGEEEAEEAEEEEQACGVCANAPLPSSAASIQPGPASVPQASQRRRSCLKGKRGVRRHGKPHCVKKRHRKNHKHLQPSH